MLFSHKGSIFATGGDFVNGPNVNGLYFPFGLKWHLELLCKTLIHLIFHSESWFRSVCFFPLPFCQVSGPLSCPPCVSSVFLLGVTAILSLLFLPKEAVKRWAVPQVVPVLQWLVFAHAVKTLWWLQYKFLLYRIIILLLLCREAIGFLPIFDTPTYFTMSY